MNERPFWEYLLFFGTAFSAVFLWGQMQYHRQKAWIWRKHWIEQRFRIRVEGEDGDYYEVLNHAAGGNAFFSPEP